MDPSTIALVARGAAKLVSRYIAGKASEEQIAKLSLRYWSSVLFEMRDNITNIRDALAPTEGYSWPMLRFTFSDALLPELAKISPNPIGLLMAERIAGAFRQLKRLLELDQETGATPHEAGKARSARVNTRNTWTDYARVCLDFAEEHFEKLRAALDSDGEKVLDEDWPVEQRSLLPEPLGTQPTT